ncbi:hypothetical protein HII36_48650 [Nonomuraea sp. NN258]|uniref:hypothetical protein n=1 Tax=Nonomuraea antri TaxID=2730852 RepID=UPI00156963EE|nr:hypothetical protein [Nonomuraea antri]NRQ39650.1 hypothetical protein [Nonomuraea antri]
MTPPTDRDAQAGWEGGMPVAAVPVVPEVPVPAGEVPGPDVTKGDVPGVAVGVVMAGPPQGELGEWLADAVAFEAAGADALWLDHRAVPPQDPPDPADPKQPADPPNPPDPADPLVLVAALAALTYRSLLVVAVPPPAPAALATLVRLSRDRLVLVTDGNPPHDPCPYVRRLPDGGYQAETGRWTAVEVPQGRGAWREALRAAAGRGDRGVLVPADPRVLDLLRNPGDPAGRHDLHLAQG